MATLSFLLPSPPASWSSAEPSKFHKQPSAPVKRKVEAAGRHFAAQASRRIHGRTISEDERTRREEVAAKIAALRNAATEETDEVEHPSLHTLDPQKWKSQDHYQVLGLSSKRFDASAEDIKRAYNKKALKHHPDKKSGDDKFFKCIQMAHNVLSDPVKRRQFDSADPGISDDFPSTKSKGDFYKTYGPYFKREGRFSTKQPVPELGDAESPKSHVESFYDFFYNFDSWRTFEYLDKHDTDLADNRDDKRHLDKKNRAERAQKKKDDNTRVRQFVDQAMKLDPRIAKFRAEDSKRRNAKKNARGEAEREAAEEKKKAEEEAKAVADKEAAVAKVAADEAKKEKEKKKNALKWAKKNLKRSLADNNYFLETADAATPAQVEEQLTKLDALFGKLSVDDLEALLKELEDAKADKAKATKIFGDAVAK